MDKYQWLPTESALEKYPMRIIQGSFLCDGNISVYIPPDRLTFNGLGEIGSTHLTEEKLKPLPDEIYVAWFSYAENKFYEGSFNLPVALLSEFFKKGTLSPGNGGNVIFDRIIVGLWPEGNLSVYVSAEGVVKELYFNKGNEINMNWVNFFDNKTMLRSQYIESTLKEVLNKDDLDSLRLHGVPLQLADKYRKPYRWRSVFITEAEPQNIWHILFNGEHEFINYARENKEEIKDRPLPKKNILRWTNLRGQKFICFITYHEEEIFAAFDKLFPGQTRGEAEIQFEINDAGKTIKVFITNDSHFLELKKCYTRLYAE